MDDELIFHRVDAEELADLEPVPPSCFYCREPWDMDAPDYILRHQVECSVPCTVIEPVGWRTAFGEELRSLCEMEYVEDGEIAAFLEVSVERVCELQRGILGDDLIEIVNFARWLDNFFSYGPRLYGIVYDAVICQMLPPEESA